MGHQEPVVPLVTSTLMTKQSPKHWIENPYTHLIAQMTSVLLNDILNIFLQNKHHTKFHVTVIFNVRCQTLPVIYITCLNCSKIFNISHKQCSSHKIFYISIELCAITYKINCNSHMNSLIKQILLRIQC